MEHMVFFEAGFDCILFECVHGSKNCKPESWGSHGRHGLQIRFVSKGAIGAVQFVIYTGWTPQYVEPSSVNYRRCVWGNLPPIPVDLGCHSKTPIYEGDEPASASCSFLDGAPCYYEGSSLNAGDAMYALVNGGDEALWAFLDAYYESVFNDAPYPQPAEFKMPPRKMQ